VFDWTGLFGGRFLNSAGAPTLADFTDRPIYEEFNGTEDTCYDVATTIDPNTLQPYYVPDGEGCGDFATFHNEDSWVVGQHTANCAAAPIGKYGTCCDHSTTLDAIGYLGVCIDNYLRDYDSPHVSTPNCYSRGVQELWITCREEWTWGHKYESAHAVGTLVTWNDPGGPLEFKNVQSGRDGQLTVPRSYPTGAAACTDPP
jgi:hypothetical protein